MFNKNRAHTIVYTVEDVALGRRGCEDSWVDRVLLGLTEAAMAVSGAAAREMGAPGRRHLQRRESMIDIGSKRATQFAGLAAFFSVVLTSVGCSHSKPAPSAGMWDPKAAAAYLDRRMQWWIGWNNSARDHETFCFSCHTAVPYALARPALRATLAESAAPAAERQLMEDVRRRVRLWGETSPFYTDQYVAPGKSAESLGSEAVLSALMLAWDDARTGHLSADTVAAFDHMWAEQHASGDSAGAWSWLDFDLSPWESAAADAQYYGAALAALSVGVAPENYQSRPQIESSMRLLRDYLAREYPAQSLHHRLILLWASTRLPGVLDSEHRQSLVAEVLRAQNPDGGWSLSALMTKSSKSKLSYPESDGYATGLVTLVLGQTAMPAAAPQVQRGLTWLMRNQKGHGGTWIRGQEGFWVARSLNTWRNPWSNVGRFMSDAATAYAVLALTESSQVSAPVPSARR
jgi:squalene-hopene/tetraprenyl-beta-curcumene cyclase